MKLTKLQIIEETVEFYSQDVSRRSKGEYGCMYNGENNTHCAFARCMINPSQALEGKTASYCLSGNSYNNIGIMNQVGVTDHLLKEEYQGHEMLFWNKIQSLHDDDDNWNPNGLTDSGIENVKILKEKYK